MPLCAFSHHAAPGLGRPSVTTTVAPQTLHPLGMYMREMRTHTLLSMEDEQRLGRRIEQGNLAIRRAVLTSSMSYLDLLSLDARARFHKGDILPSRLAPQDIERLEVLRERWRRLAEQPVATEHSVVQQRVLDAEIGLSRSQVRSISSAFVGAARELRALGPGRIVAIEDRMHAAADEILRVDREVRRGEAVLGEAVAEMVQGNLRLVFRYARHQAHRGLPLLDLLQEGNLALIDAAERFDHRRGNKFSTYAVWWIRQAMTRAIADQARLIRLPAYMEEEVARLHRSTTRLTQSLGHSPTPEEIATGAGIPLSRLERLDAASSSTCSLDAPVGEEETARFGDFIEDDRAVSPEDEARDHLVRGQLELALARLPARERFVIQQRFGLGCRGGRSLEDIGEELGVCRERVRQLQKRALERLREDQVVEGLYELLAG